MEKLWKYSANGNHFVLLDGLRGSAAPDAKRVQSLCHPAFGVGADGVAHISAGDTPHAFRFRLWNSDGGEAEMCGNAARAAAWHFFQHHAPEQSSLTFRTMNGVYEARREGERLWVKMTEKKADLRPDPALFAAYSHYFYLNTGVPHLVLEVPDVDKLNLNAQAAPWRHHFIFPRGTNVDFITRVDAETVKLRVFERGVEGETWSCGTGVAAVAWAAREFYGPRETLTVRTKGGDHRVRWDAEGALWYSGDVKLVFTAESAI